MADANDTAANAGPGSAGGLTGGAGNTPQQGDGLGRVNHPGTTKRESGAPANAGSRGTPAADGDPSTSGISSAPKFHVDRSHYGAALQEWMTAALGAKTLITDLEIPVATGFSNETVMFNATRPDAPAPTRYVARIEPHDGGMFPVQSPGCPLSVELQYRVMRAVRDARLKSTPIPRMIGYEPDTAVLGRPFFVMEFVEGLVPSDVPRYTQAGFLVDEATPVERRRLALTGVEAMAGVHSIDWRAAGLQWLNSTGGDHPVFADQLNLYRRQIVSELGGREHPVAFASLDWLEDNNPFDNRVGLTWGDARVGNVIWQDYRPAAVLDWEACAISPTEADVGWWMMFDRMSHKDLGVERLEGFPTRAEMIEHYESVSGRAVRHPHYWEVFATMRFAAIFVRLGDRMTSVGMIPPDLNPAVANPVTASLAALLGIDNPTPSLMSL